MKLYRQAEHMIFLMNKYLKISGAVTSLLLRSSNEQILECKHYHIGGNNDFRL
jgi:hypothetical protein